jgi:hypothetical protein
MALTKVPSNLDATIATTQSQADNSTNIATTAYVDLAISNLSDSAPAALNTLNEIAAALGDDANYASTTTAAIAGKLPLAGGTMTGNLTVNAIVDADNYTINGGQGTDGQVLTSTGTGVAWESIPAGTTINNNADNRIITGSGTADTLEGESGLTYDGSTLAVTGTATMDGLTITAATPSIQMTDSDNNADAYIQATDGNIRFYADDNNEAADSIVTFNIDGSERMRSAGNNLHLNGGIDARIQLGTGGAGANQVSNNTVHIRGDGADMKLMAASGGIFQFEQNGTERLRIQSGGGISFNGDTAAANALDDYEEGTHTTTITCSVSGTVTLYSDVNKLNYVKIGKMVHIQGMLTASAVSSPSGYFTVSLPFNISSWGGVYAGRGTGTIWLNTGSSNNVADYVVLLVQGESSARVYLGDNTGVQSDSANNIGANDDIYVGLTYISN